MAHSPNVLQATDSNFESEVLKSQQLTLVDFWAEWCGPCKPLGQTIGVLADEYAGKVKMAMLNVENNPQIAVRYQVRGLPTVLVFKGGQLVDQLAGNQPKDNLVQLIQKHLG